MYKSNTFRRHHRVGGENITFFIFYYREGNERCVLVPVLPTVVIGAATPPRTSALRTSFGRRLGGCFPVLQTEVFFGMHTLHFVPIGTRAGLFIFGV